MMKKKMKKNIEYYLNLPYTFELSYDPDHAWFIRVKELPGCTSQGETPDEAVVMIKDAMQLWIEDALEEGEAVPEPRPEEEYSGKFVVRVPKLLHRHLVETSEAEGVSLNQYINVALARALGMTPSSTIKEKTKEPASTAYWPGLDDAIRHILADQHAAGKAGEIDERLFAEWVGQKLHELSSAYRQGRFEDVTSGMQVLRYIFQENAWRSAAINLWVQMLTFQQQLVEDMQSQQEEASQEAQLLSQVGEMLRQINHSQLRSPNSRAVYSQAAMRPELALQSGFFGTKVQVVNNE